MQIIYTRQKIIIAFFICLLIILVSRHVQASELQGLVTIQADEDLVKRLKGPSDVYFRSGISEFTAELNESGITTVKLPEGHYKVVYAVTKDGRHVSLTGKFDVIGEEMTETVVSFSPLKQSGSNAALRFMDFLKNNMILFIITVLAAVVYNRVKTTREI